ncbi:MAG: gliding motility-associated ABC transporter permease subunit GldF [Bacteroidota bacterium]
MYPILKKEIAGFLGSVTGYAIICIFLAGTGLFVWVYPDTNIIDSGYADLQTLFSMGPFVFIFLVPAITMRSFAEERRNGTMELLLTRPLSELQIVMGKYLACVLLVALSLLPTLVYYVSIYKLGIPEGNIDSAAVAGSFCGMLLLGAVFAAIGILASTLFDNQIMAFITGAFFCWLMYQGIGSLAQNTGQTLAPYISWLGLDFHYQSMGKGLIDSRDLVYFISFAGILLGAARLRLQARNW